MIGLFLRARLTLLTLSGCLALTSMAQAQNSTVLYTDAPNYGYFSQGSGPGSANYSASDFYLSSSALLTNVTWWGTDGNGGSGSNQFAVQLFTANHSGDPKRTPDATFLLGTLTVTDTGMQNGQYNGSGGEVYQYSAVLTTPYHLAADTQYYLGITETDPNDPWSWQYGSDNNNHYYRPDTSSAWGGTEVGLAFQLSGTVDPVPELSTFVGFGSFVALGGLAAFRQRKQARQAV